MLTCTYTAAAFPRISRLTCLLVAGGQTAAEAQTATGYGDMPGPCKLVPGSHTGGIFKDGAKHKGDLLMVRSGSTSVKKEMCLLDTKLPISTITKTIDYAAADIGDLANLVVIYQ